LFIYKFKKTRKYLFWINHILFDIIIILKPILWYMAIKV
jgi:hypothetical protein